VFQIVIVDRPDSIHGRYQVFVDFDVPETWTPKGDGKLTPAPRRNWGYVGARDDLALALVVARQVQHQGVKAHIRTEAITVPDPTLDPADHVTVDELLERG
jgi:hypothetical protein